MTEPRLMRATGLGSMPGEDFAESLQIVLGEVGGLPFLPELPARGTPAGMVGRTVGMINQLGIDLQPAGWRLTDAHGIDHRRAASLLAQDLDTVEEVTAGAVTQFKVQVVGPWTLAALVEKPRGDKVISDVGARRDLAQALAESVADHVATVRRRLGVTSIVVQVDEPMLPAVLAGAVSTASGFSRHRSVTAPDAASALTWIAEAIAVAGAASALHCCASDVPYALLRQTPFEAVSFDLSLFEDKDFDEIAEWLDTGRDVWPGVVAAIDPPGRPPTDADLTRTVLRWWSDLGFEDPAAIPSTTVTPTCGLAGASPSWARQALTLAAKVAANLEDDDRR